MTLTKSQIENHVSEVLLEHFGADVAAPVAVEEIVDNLGGRIEVRFEDYLDPESLHVAADGTFTIFVPSNTSVARDRFTIAHELGHLLLHHEGTDEATFKRYGRSSQETEANAFAGALLMPAGLFRDAWARHGGDLRRLAREFGVSQSAADVRCQVLNLSI